MRGPSGSPWTAYVAGRTGEIERVRSVQQMVRDCGGEITFDWTGPDGDIRTDWRVEAPRARELSMRERQAVMGADVTILCGVPTGGLGCYIEVGIAMAFELPVVILGPARESVFWYLPGVERLDHDHQVRAWLNLWREGIEDVAA